MTVDERHFGCMYEVQRHIDVTSSKQQTVSLFWCEGLVMVGGVYCDGTNSWMWAWPIFVLGVAFWLHWEEQINGAIVRSGLWLILDMIHEEAYHWYLMWEGLMLVGGTGVVMPNRGVIVSRKTCGSGLCCFVGLRGCIVLGERGKLLVTYGLILAWFRKGLLVAFGWRYRCIDNTNFTKKLTRNVF